jgi:hypothetical protein
MVRTDDAEEDGASGLNDDGFEKSSSAAKVMELRTYNDLWKKFRFPNDMKHSVVDICEVGFSQVFLAFFFFPLI